MLIAASAVSVFPVLFIVFLSLRGRDGWQEPTRFVGFDLSNYRHILGQTKFLTWFGNSLVVALGATVIGVLISASAGYAVSRMRFPGHRPLMWTFLVVQMFPMAVLIVPLYNILGQLELLDSYGGLILTYCSVSVPFCAWMLKGYFDSIPTEIDEAGRVDGLTPFGTFWRLIMPLARPGLAVTGFYSFITAWGEVAFASQFMSSEEHYTLAVGLQTFVGQQKAEWGADDGGGRAHHRPGRRDLLPRPAAPGGGADRGRHQGLTALTSARRRRCHLHTPRTKNRPYDEPMGST
ncbi:hypothetical protein GCM10020000_58210 [Streptomyces olivoverticillatus]